MSVEPISTDPSASPPATEPVWGATVRRPWGLRETAAAVGVAAVIAALGGAAIYAAAGSGAGGSHSAGPAFGPGGPPFGTGGPPGGMPGTAPDVSIAQALHGEFVQADPGGGYTTVVTQTGTVTSASGTSLTVRSDDGYVLTYTLPPAAGSTGRAHTAGDEVTVRAVRTGPTVTVTGIAAREPGGSVPTR